VFEVIIAKPYLHWLMSVVCTRLPRCLGSVCSNLSSSRTFQVAQKVIVLAASRDVLLFEHGHILRILSCCWLVCRPNSTRLGRDRRNSTMGAKCESVSGQRGLVLEPRPETLYRTSAPSLIVKAITPPKQLPDSGFMQSDSRLMGFVTGLLSEGAHVISPMSQNHRREASGRNPKLL
jgi:hypothetical protein